MADMMPLSPLDPEEAMRLSTEVKSSELKVLKVLNSELFVAFRPVAAMSKAWSLCRSPEPTVHIMTSWRKAKPGTPSNP